MSSVSVLPFSLNASLKHMFLRCLLIEPSSLKQLSVALLLKQNPDPYPSGPGSGPLCGPSFHTRVSWARTLSSDYNSQNGPFSSEPPHVCLHWGGQPATTVTLPDSSRRPVPPSAWLPDALPISLWEQCLPPLPLLETIMGSQVCLHPSPGM